MTARKPNPETALMHEIQAATADRVLWWRNNVGCAKVGPRFIKYGLGGTGGSDLIGVVRGSGRFVACEVKVPGEDPTDKQAEFIELVRAAGGLAFVAHSVEEARSALGVRAAPADAS